LVSSTAPSPSAHAVSHLAEPQIEARRLDLVGDKVVGRQDRTLLRERFDHPVGQDAFLVDCEGERHVGVFLRSESDSRWAS
jgi:hypothetical protein